MFIEQYVKLMSRYLSSVLDLSILSVYVHRGQMVVDEEWSEHGFC